MDDFSENSTIHFFFYFICGFIDFFQYVFLCYVLGIENVVTKIFENINEGSDRIHIDSFLELVSLFIQPNTAEFSALKEIICSISTDGMISESQTKSALVKLTKNLSKKTDARFVMNNSNLS